MNYFACIYTHYHLYFYICIFILKVVSSHQHLQISSNSLCVITITYSVNLPSSTISLINLLVQSIPVCICSELPVATRLSPHQVDILLLGPRYPFLDWCHPYSLRHVDTSLPFLGIVIPHQPTSPFRAQTDLSLPNLDSTPDQLPPPMDTSSCPSSCTLHLDRLPPSSLSKLLSMKIPLYMIFLGVLAFILILSYINFSHFLLFFFS